MSEVRVLVGETAIQVSLLAVNCEVWLPDVSASVFGLTLLVFRVKTTGWLQQCVSC